jgi:hypothetical protein
VFLVIPISDRVLVWQEAGIDVRLGELGGAIQETMESYEVEVGGKVFPGVFSCVRAMVSHWTCFSKVD